MKRNLQINLDRVQTNESSTEDLIRNILFGDKNLQKKEVSHEDNYRQQLRSHG